MGYTGQRPSAIPLTTADLIDGSITNADIADLDAAKLTGTVADARISSSSVNAHVDLTPVRQDIAMLAIREGVTENKVAYNLTNSFIDIFQDDSGITTETDVDRNASEYVSTASTGSPTYATFTTGTATWSVPAGVDTAEILLVGGGGSGAKSPNVMGGGGGGGGVAHIASYTFTATDKSSGIVYVAGAGGTGVGTSGGSGAYDGGGINGADTTFAISGGTITAKGGGYGAGYGGGNPHPSFSGYFAASAGGSGGGGTHSYLSGAATNQASFSGWTTYGNAGGTTTDTTGNLSSGGGGAGGAAANASVAGVGTTGGAGQLFSNFTSYGASGYFGAGGAGTGATTQPSGTNGGGGGGTSAHESGYDATDGTGAGGGGTWWGGSSDYTYKGGDGGNGFIGILYTPLVTTATGTLISDQQTVPSAITKMSGVILYKENAGDSVLGTHLKIYFSATGTGASDWVEATYTDVTAEFSTGIKMARLGSTTVPSGTLPTMKAVWASQVASSLETQLHGWAMNY